jgi:hypothetical protein
MVNNRIGLLKIVSRSVIKTYWFSILQEVFLSQTFSQLEQTINLMILEGRGEDFSFI